MGAHLAHGEHDVTGPGFWIFAIRRRELLLLDGLTEKITDSDAERGLGDIGQRLGDARDRPDAADIG